MWSRVLLAVALVACMIPTRPAGAETATPEAEAPESAVSSPPMEMDDPATPGPNGVEVNFVSTLVHLGQGRSSEGLLDANYGIGNTLQLKFERPYLREHDAGSTLQHGLGASELGVKWRFLEVDGFEVAMYPQYQFNDGFVLKDEEGNPEDSEGRSTYFPLLVSKTFDRIYTLAFNYGFRHNLEGHGDDNNVAVGMGRAVGSDARVLAELYSERDESFRNRQTDVRVGYCFLPFPKAFEHSHFELPVYASLGHSIGATEAGEHSTSLAFGLSFVVKPSE